MKEKLVREVKSVLTLVVVIVSLVGICYVVHEQSQARHKHHSASYR